MRARRRKTAYHEAAHAVAAYFYPRAGRSQRITLDARDLGLHNEGKQSSTSRPGSTPGVRRYRPCAAASSWIARRSRICCACSWPVTRRRSCSTVRCRSSASGRKRGSQRLASTHADEEGDTGRALALLAELSPFDEHAAAASVPADQRGLSPELLAEHFGAPAVRSWQAARSAELDAARREVLAFVAAKWPHVHAVAEALLRQGALDGDAIRQLIERIEERLARTRDRDAWGVLLDTGAVGNPGGPHSGPGRRWQPTLAPGTMRP